MKPRNAEQRKKMILRFAALYIASVILMLIIFSAFSGKTERLQQNRNGVGIEKPEPSVNPSEQERVLAEARQLYSPFKNLQQLEERFASLLIDSSGSPHVENLRKTIAASEQGYKKTIDSIERGVGKYKSDINAEVVGQIVALSRLAMESRDDLPEAPASFPVQEPAPDQPMVKQTADKQTIAKWQKEVSRRNERIAELERQLKSQQRENRSLRLALTGNASQK